MSSALPDNIYSLCEVVADLAANFAIAQSRPENSRETTRLIIEWAEIFQARHKDRAWDGEYIEVVDEFFSEMYSAWETENFSQ